MAAIYPVRGGRSQGTGKGWIAGRTTGIVTLNGVPTATRVYLLDTKTNRIHLVVQSNAFGEYEFEYIDTEPKRWVVFARMRDASSNAVIADHITAVTMPQFT